MNAEIWAAQSDLCVVAPNKQWAHAEQMPSAAALRVVISSAWPAIARYEPRPSAYRYTSLNLLADPTTRSPGAHGWASATTSPIPTAGTS
ncbi:MAG: hypothetical protein ACLUE1_08030 [Adlercreutzia equolifaciens]